MGRGRQTCTNPVAVDDLSIEKSPQTKLYTNNKTVVKAVEADTTVLY